VVKQSNETQYDIDLTLSNDDYDESYYSDADDLFEFTTDDESPISRLKSLVLSIDWEITDDVLLQFNEELLDLKDIWAGETINLVYVQALEKISKYIYQNKADSHPNAIKLLLTFYYNLEKIVSSQELSEQQKKDILLEDVKKFENLKRQIKQKPSSGVAARSKTEQLISTKGGTANANELLNLKAIILGIDWEITEQDLNRLRQEVARLEEKFSDSRPKLILLQGIGTLGGYIKIKKSNSHPDAFKVMQLFYESLEEIIAKQMSLEEEKKVLFPAVEKFNSFKMVIGPTISPESISKKDDESRDEYDTEKSSGEMAPALSGFEEEEVGFQAEKEAIALGIQDADGVASHLDDFFGESASSPQTSEEIILQPEEEKVGQTPLDFPEDVIVPVGRDHALLGVDVEEDEEDFDQEMGPQENGLSSDFTSEIVFKEDDLPAAEVAADRTTAEISSPGTNQSLEVVRNYETLDRETALKGVDVETEADDDTDELSLPMEGEELAPALVAMDEESLFSASTLANAPADNSVTNEIVGTIDGLFLDNEKILSGHIPEDDKKEEQISETSAKEIKDHEASIVFEDWLQDTRKSDLAAASQIDTEAVNVATSSTLTAESIISDSLLTTDELNSISEEIKLAEEQEVNLSSFFTESELDTSSQDSFEVDALFESLDKEVLEESIRDISTDFNRSDELTSSASESNEAVGGRDVQLDILIDNGFDEVTTVEQSVSPGGDELSPSEEMVVFELAEEVNKSETDSFYETGDAIATETVTVEAVNEEGERNIDLPSYTDSEIYNVFPSSYDGRAENIASEDPFSELRACIHSLGIELSDTIIAGLFNEIEKLQKQWINKPLEKLFSHLLLVVWQHIDNFRYESSAEAHGLLVALCLAISKLKDDDMLGNQEILLAETLRVLEWQQNMLLRQAVKTGDQLSLVAPVRVEVEGGRELDAQKEFDDILRHYDVAVESEKDSDAAETGILDIKHLGSEEGLGSFEDAEKEFLRANEWSQEMPSEVNRETFRDDLKKEIAALRLALQTEISELRKELKKE
jgi:pilus assembly protein FimV